MFEFQCSKWNGKFWEISIIRSDRERKCWNKIKKLLPEKVVIGSRIYLLINTIYVSINFDVDIR